MMMMMQKPTVEVPPWSLFEDTNNINYNSLLSDAGYGLYEDSDDSDSALDAYSCDEFRMYEFKIRRCARGRSHDWTECPFAHPGEKARRRDPRKYHYSGTACPDFRKGNCKRGDACGFAHGVFECWLHPARYRTQPCKDGTACRRRVCFFAHTADQLRVVSSNSNSQLSPKTPDSYDGSPMRVNHFMASPPLSPTGESPSSAEGMRRASWPVNEVLASLRKLQLGKVKLNSASGGGGLFGSPRAGFCSLPGTPNRVGGWVWTEEEEEPVFERVESGRAIRAKMYERLSKEVEKQPDVGWVSELVM